jgi:hypothetical protein
MMSTYACRECGATDGFESYESVPTKFYIFIADEDGEPSVAYSGESKIASGDSGDDPLYVCGACGNEANDLDGLVKKVA